MTKIRKRSISIPPNEMWWLEVQVGFGYGMCDLVHAAFAEEIRSAILL